MRSHALYYPALVVSALGATIVVLSVFLVSVRAAAVRPMTFVAVAVVVALFFRMLFDPRCRRGIDAANIELRGGAPWPGKVRPFMYFDPQWGLFGTRTGDRSLQVIRLILFIEFVTALVLSGDHETDLLLLSMFSFAATMLLTIIHVGLNTEGQTV
jgi:hypothetical protein